MRRNRKCELRSEQRGPRMSTEMAHHHRLVAKNVMSCFQVLSAGESDQTPSWMVLSMNLARLISEVIC